MFRRVSIWILAPVRWLFEAFQGQIARAAEAADSPAAQASDSAFASGGNPLAMLDAISLAEAADEDAQVEGKRDES